MITKKYKYELTVQFETDQPVKQHDSRMIQYENLLEYAVHDAKCKNDVGMLFQYGTGKLKLKKIKIVLKFFRILPIGIYRSKDV